MKGLETKYAESRFCEMCGTRTLWKPRDGGTGKLETCPNCGHRMFRNSKPCVGALVIDNGRIALIKRSIEPFKDFWDIPGGFLDETEHPKDGAVREVREETGLEIEPTEILDIFIDSYAGCQYTHNVYYIAKPVGGKLTACDESSDARWFPLSDLPNEIAFPNHAWEVLNMLKDKLKEREK
ncbi:MAG: NUDIX domain-containing protein [bacterium]